LAVTAARTLDLILYSAPYLFPTRSHGLAHLFVEPHNGFRWQAGALTWMSEGPTLERFAAWARERHDRQFAQSPEVQRQIQVERSYEALRAAGVQVVPESMGFLWWLSLWPGSALVQLPDDITEDWASLAQEAIDALRDQIVPPLTEAALNRERLGARLLNRPSRAQQEAWLAEAAARLRALRAS
jgi:hypothetical protein